MKNFLICFSVLILASCGGGNATQAPKVSRVENYSPHGMNYMEFRDYMDSKGDVTDDYNVMHKRFLMLDRDNNGVLSPTEMGGL